MVACPKHKTLLVDRCDACGQRLPDQRERIEFCSCGHSLVQSKTTPATETQLWVSAVIASGRAGSETGFPALDNVLVEEFALLVRTLCQLIDPSLTVTRENAAAPKTVLIAIEFLRPLEHLLAHWPQGFAEHVRERVAFGPRDARTLNTRLGKWYLRIKEVGFDGPLNVFLEAIHDVAIHEYADSLALDHVVGYQGRRASHLMLLDAAASIGVHGLTLRKAIAAGEVECITRPYANRGSAREIPVVEVERIAEARRGWIGEAAAREKLDVPEHVFKGLVQAGLITSDNSARTDIRRGSPVEVASLERLLHRLNDAGQRECLGTAPRVRLNEVGTRRIGDKQALGRFLEAIANDDVHPVNRAQTVGSFEFLQSDVDTFFTSRAVEAGLTVQALAKTTGWKWESISHWIDEGFLDSMPAVLRGQPCRVVMPEHLVKFSQTYVPLSSLAHSMESRSSELLERLGAIKVVGGKRLPSGAMRGGLVRMEDLAAAALQPALCRTTG